MSGNDVFHEGEIAIQERTGERAMALRTGVAIRDRIIPGARAFLAAQHLVVLAAADADGGLWASLRFGPPGFVRSDDDGTVVRAAASLGSALSGDPLDGQVAAGQRVGLLAIELASRRRLRINGVVSALDGEAMVVEVREAFPNCPKYIQRRRLHPREASAPRPAIARGEALDGARRELVARVDTAFVASSHPVRGIDASHRGGPPGFIHVEDAHTLRFPDYPGNGMFQTLGNLAVDPRAGLALVDFAGGRVLSLTGTARTSFGAEDPAHPTGGTGRYWQFTVARWVDLALPSTVDWELLDRSPFNP